MNLLIYGRGGHSKVIADACNFPPKYESIDFIDDNQASAFNIEEQYNPNKWSIFVAIGDNYSRERIFLRCKSFGYRIVSIFHERSFVSSDAEVKEGVYVGPMACILPGAMIGVSVIINTGASVDHDCEIGAFCHIAPGARLCGSIKVGERTLIGVGASVIPRIAIGKNCIIAGGSVINKDIPDNSMVAGTPAVHKKTV